MVLNKKWPKNEGKYILYSICFSWWVSKKWGIVQGIPSPKIDARQKDMALGLHVKERQGERSKRCDSIKRSCGIVETD